MIIVATRSFQWLFYSWCKQGKRSMSFEAYFQIYRRFREPTVWNNKQRSSFLYQLISTNTRGNLHRIYFDKCCYDLIWVGINCFEIHIIIKILIRVIKMSMSIAVEPETNLMGKIFVKPDYRPDIWQPHRQLRYAAKKPMKCQSDTTFSTSNLADLGLHDIWRLDVRSPNSI